MAQTLFLGAINKENNLFTIPFEASKKDKYICPDCKEDVILKKGDIKKPHFAHFSHSKCVYYDHPNESEIHKTAKYLLKNIFQTAIVIILKNCCSCGKKDNIELETLKCPIFKTEEELDKTILFNGSKIIPDTALFDGEQLKYIFEILFTHKTSAENRPEPWFEFNANLIIEKAVQLYTTKLDTEKQISIQIDCVRPYLCKYCIDLNETIKPLCLFCTGFGVCNKTTEPGLCVKCRKCCNGKKSKCTKCNLLKRMCEELGQLSKMIKKINALGCQLKKQKTINFKKRNLETDYNIGTSFFVPYLWNENIFTNTLERMQKDKKDLEKF